MSLKINSPIGGVNSLNSVNAPEIMKYAKVEQMSESNTEDDSAYEEIRKNN